MAEVIGTYACTCCCRGRKTEHTDYGCKTGYMQCGECGCRKPMETPLLALRITHAGQATVDSLTDFLRVAQHLGAPGDSPLKMSDASMYIDIPGDLFTTNLEIDAIRRTAQAN